MKALNELNISESTVIYAYGEDHIDPIHFSADERDMRVVCHHDEIRNWIQPEDFRNDALVTHRLWMQADLPVLTLEFCEDKWEEFENSEEKNKKFANAFPSVKKLAEDANKAVLAEAELADGFGI